MRRSVVAQERLANLPGVRLVMGQALKTPESVMSNGHGKKFLTKPSKQPREKIVKDFLTANAEMYGLTAREVAQLRKVSDYTNPGNNLSWLELRQEIKGIPVFQGEVRAALTTEGELVGTVSRLTPALASFEINPDDFKGTRISAAAAVSKAAESIGITVNPDELVIKETAADGRYVVFEPGPFADNITVELQYFPLEPGVITEAWSMVLWQETPAYLVIVDAEEGGDLLWRKNITSEQTQPATYSVYNDDNPAPLSPSNALPGSGIQGTPISRTLFTLISEGAAFNNLGWITDGGNTTTGNNVDAGIDVVSPNGIDPAGRPVGSPFRVFDFPYNPPPGIPGPGDAPNLANFRNGVVTDLFFWSNRYHDILYQLGFTEAARNFQLNNFGRGGLGNDFVRAEAQDSSSINNANFSTPADGQLPRMQMFIFPGPNPDRDGDLDHDIVIHELTHGTSSRLHANASGLTTTVSQGMGEGWSDFYARAILATPDEDVNGVYPAGAYATFQLSAVGNNNYYYGIRRFPYAVKTNVGANGKPHNPLTFADTDPVQMNTTDGAFPESPMLFSLNGATEVHNLGEIWAMALLEVRARIINTLGFAAGNQRAMQIVTDGMKLDVANPNMLQGRDAILTADCAGFGGADEVQIWEGFATRGMGFSARVNAGTSVTEAFDVPNLAVGSVVLSNDSCDNFGVADPGETVTLTIPLTNPFCATPSDGVTLTLPNGNSVSYGDIPAGETVTRDITYTIPDDTQCSTQLAVQATVNSSIGSVIRPIVLQIGVPTATLPPVVHSTGNVAVPILDNSTVDIPITINDAGAIADVNVSVRLNHSFDGDLQLRLVSPDGTIVNLANNRGSSGDNFGTGVNDCSGTPTTFDDSATTAISAGVSPFTGSFRPENPLSVFIGKQMTGVWKLRVTDTANQDQGTVGCVKLQINQRLYFCCGVPGTPLIEPAPPVAMVTECGTNGSPDGGEVVTMGFPLKNNGSGLTSNLTATLQASGGITPLSGPQSYGALSPIGPSATRNFTFAVDDSAACGSNVTATFLLEDQGVSLGTVSFPILVGTIITNTTTLSNTTPIAIPGTGTGAITGSPANPYPSSIVAAGIAGVVTKVRVTLNNFSHTFPGDMDVLLVGPQGQKFVMLSDVVGGTDAVNITWTLDDAAAALLPSAAAPVSGTFKPTNIGTGDAFPAPAPAAPYQNAASAGTATFASLFNGINPNGTWSLYAVDDAGVDSGSIAGGWTLAITTEASICETIPAVDIANASVDKPSLWPPNHTMQDIIVNYDVGCSSCSLGVTSNEAVNGTGDGDTDPDWEIVDNHHVRLRAERSGNGSGRVYTITITCTNGVNTDVETLEVHVDHNITGPASGTAFKINTPVNFSGTFWDVVGRTHTASWLFDAFSTVGTVVEPSGPRKGTVNGAYSFATPGVYKVKMKVTNNQGVTTSVDMQNDVEAIVVIYDPSGGYTVGGGWVTSPPGAYVADPSLTGKVSFGFTSKYFKNATNPKGETQFSFKLGELEFNAVNFDYLVIAGAKAQFKGFGKINGGGAYEFVLTVIDGDLPGGDGVDRFRMKIQNKTSGAVVYDNQLGASDADDPTTPVGAGSVITIQK
ncbi:MAG TPA: M36 family metallopeptidase [Pyrinomonadaceae bacterium]|nr:M36 family metallopeptidase [Pyrinomonadaceae bacterium]